MTHDPLCPYRPEYQGQGATTPYVASIQYATHVDCQCELIAKVRGDERAKVATQVEDMASQMRNWSSPETEAAIGAYPELTAEQWIWAQRGMYRALSVVRNPRDTP